MTQKQINSADLKGWGTAVGKSLDRVTVIHDYFCGICSRPLQTLESPLVFINLHTLITEVLWHLKTEHPDAIPVRPEAK